MLVLSKETDQSLSAFLKEQGTLTPEQYDQAVAQISSGKSIIEFSVEQNFITEDSIADTFVKAYSIEKIDLQMQLTIDRPMKEELTDHFIVKNRIVPLKMEGDILTIVIADTEAYKNIETVRTITKKELKICVTTLSSLEQYMRKITAKTGGQAAIQDDGSNDVLSPKDAFMQALATEEESGNSDKPKTFISTGSDVIDFVNNVIENAISMTVSDIHIELFTSTARVRYRCDGVLKAIDEYADFLVKNYSAITTRIKILSSLDISERRLPQDGGISFDMGDRMVDLRVSILPTSHGERIVMRIIDQSAADFSLEQLGLSEDIYKAVCKAADSPQGMILVTGPTGSGKSTSLYAMVKRLNTPDINVMTAEDPVEYDLTGIGQVKVKDSIGLTFSAALRSFLRQDPEVIMVGEIRDKDTGDIAIKASLTGHLVLSTLHTNDAPSTITRLINMGVPNYMLTSSLTLVMAQRLARKLCEHCKEPDPEATEAALRAIGFSEEESKTVKAMVGKGCDKCAGMGAKGRRAIHEVLVITRAVKDVVLNNGNDVDIKKAAVEKDGFIDMQTVGRRLIAEGIIGLTEYKRVLAVEDL
ncbi:GspE/PulE family protein [Rickettsiales bacterium]|nr:GspE/PulE family protein [Rickettsiales bacterium]